MAFDIAGARKEGYSDLEIAEFLGKESKFDVQGALKEGYSPNDVLGFLSTPKNSTGFKSTSVRDIATGIKNSDYPTLLKQDAEKLAEPYTATTELKNSPIRKDFADRNREALAEGDVISNSMKQKGDSAIAQLARKQAKDILLENKDSNVVRDGKLNDIENIRNRIDFTYDEKSALASKITEPTPAVSSPVSTDVFKQDSDTAKDFQLRESDFAREYPISSALISSIPTFTSGVIKQGIAGINEIGTSNALEKNLFGDKARGVSLTQNADGSIDSNFENFKRELLIDPNSNAANKYLDRTAQSYTSGIAKENWKKALDEGHLGTWAAVTTAQQLPQVAMMVGSAITRNPSLLNYSLDLMAASAGGNSYGELIKAGVPQTEAAAISLVNGQIEKYSEKMGFDAIGSIVGKQMTQAFAKQTYSALATGAAKAVGLAGITEYGEEFSGSIASDVLSKAIADNALQAKPGNRELNRMSNKSFSAMLTDANDQGIAGMAGGGLLGGAFAYRGAKDELNNLINTKTQDKIVLEQAEATLTPGSAVNSTEDLISAANQLVDSVSPIDLAVDTIATDINTTEAINTLNATPRTSITGQLSVTTPEGLYDTREYHLRADGALERVIDDPATGYTAHEVQDINGEWVDVSPNVTPMVYPDLTSASAVANQDIIATGGTVTPIANQATNVATNETRLTQDVTLSEPVTNQSQVQQGDLFTDREQNVEMNSVAPGAVSATTDVGSNIIITSSRTPFKTNVSAQRSLEMKGLQATHQVVPHQGGFGLAPITDNNSAVTDNSLPATGVTPSNIDAAQGVVADNTNSVINNVESINEQSITTEPNADPITRTIARLTADARTKATERGVADVSGVEVTRAAPESVLRRFAQPVEAAKRKIAEAISGHFGHKVVWVTASGSDLDGAVIPGMDNENIYVNMGSSVSVTRVVAHEVLHLLKKNSPTTYENYWKAAMPLIDAKLAKMLYQGDAAAGIEGDLPSRTDKNLGMETYHEEMLADTFADAIHDPKAILRLVEGMDEGNAKTFLKLLAKTMVALHNALQAGRDFRTNEFLKDVEAARDAALKAASTYYLERQKGNKSGDTNSVVDEVLASESRNADNEEKQRDYKLDITREDRAVNKVASISKSELEAVEADALKNKLSKKKVNQILAEARDTKVRFPASEGWAPLVLTGISVTTNKETGKVKITPKWNSIAYGFNKVDEDKLVVKLHDLIKDIYTRADLGDKNAQTIVAHQTWYRNVAAVLRHEYGGFGDTLADLLGATSPNTPVDTNWRFSVEILQRMISGEFNKELNSFVKYVDNGGQISKFPNEEKIRQISGKLYGMNSLNAMKALADMWRVIEPGTAPKARNFALNLIGQSNMATIDVWAARMLRRAANMIRGASLPRIPPPAEQGVTGKWNTKASEVTGEFGMGASVMDKVSALLMKDGFNITPPDLQAIAWFAEKELWGEKGWTTVTGEGGSFEENLDKQQRNRYISGFSIQQGKKAPDGANVSVAQARVLAMMSGDDSVLAARVLPTNGLYAGTIEQSFDAEWVVDKATHDPSLIMAEIAKIASENSQYDMFVSRVLAVNEDSPNARPGVEVYFKNKQSLEKAMPVLQKFVQNGQDGFTMVVDPRVTEKDAFIGVRLQYVPEISMRDDVSLRDRLQLDGEIEKELKSKKEALEAIVADVSLMDGVAHATVVKYDTVVIGKENYDGYINRGIARDNQAVGSEPWFGQPIRQGLKRAATRLNSESGQDSAASVYDASGEVPAEGRVLFSEGRRSEQTRDGRGRTESRRITPLQGSPSVPGFQGPDPRIVSIAEKYARDNGINLKRQAEYVTVDPARAKRIADAYAAMPHAPQDPKVKEAYANLIKQTTAQFKALQDAGYKFWFINTSIPANNEYASTPWNALRDLRANKQMGVFPTIEGFGSNKEYSPEANPLLEDTGMEWPIGSLTGPKQKVLANDLFRVVHDAFGHGLEGAGFRAQGEENAWQAHVRLFTGSAVAAITSETRGQNSWVNFGPNAETNRTATAENTKFADQKAGLMPEWTWTQGRAGDQDVLLSEGRRTETTDRVLGQELVDAYKALGSEIDSFAYPKVNKPTFKETLDGMAVGFRVGRPIPVRDGIKQFSITSPNGGQGMLFEKPNGEIYVNLAMFKSAKDKGSAVYAAAFDYAFYNNKVFIGDPAGLSDVALFRRTENMLSSAIKYGSTKHMRPHDKQTNPQLYQDMYDSGSVTPIALGFKWVVGNDEANIANLAMASYYNHLKVIPEIGEVEYNEQTDRFEWTDGRPFDAESFSEYSVPRILRENGHRDLLEESRLVDGGKRESHPFGSRTLQRIAMAGTVLRRQSQASREQLVADIGDRVQGGVSPLNRLMYSEGRKSQTVTSSDTPEFKAWFGDSKVVDADGKPLVVYHGTRKDFSVFKPTLGNGLLGDGMYFSASGEDASSFTGYGVDGDPPVLKDDDLIPPARVLPVYLYMTNPYVSKDKYDAPLDWAKQGYDGVIYARKNEPTWYVVKDPNQIKSAVGNNGKFDANNNDIRFSEGRKRKADDILSEKYAAAVAQSTDSRAYTVTSQALKLSQDDFEIAKRFVVPNAVSEANSDILAERMGFEVDLIDKLRIEAEKEGIPLVEVLGAAIATTRVNIARMLDSKTDSEMLTAMHESINMMVATRAHISEIARALGYVGWLQRKGGWGSAVAGTAKVNSAVTEAVNKFSPEAKGDLKLKIDEFNKVQASTADALNEFEEIADEVRKLEDTIGVAKVREIDAKREAKLIKQRLRDLKKAQDKATTPAAKEKAVRKTFSGTAVEQAKARWKERAAAAIASVKASASRVLASSSRIDAEALMDGLIIAADYIEQGMDYKAYHDAMVNDFGDFIRPYLVSFWEGARNYPGVDQVASVENKTKELEDKATKLSEGVNATEAVKATADARRAAAQAELTQLRKNLASMKSSTKAANATATKFESQIPALEAKLVQIEKELLDAKSRVASQRSQLSELNSKLTGATRKLESAVKVEAKMKDKLEAASKKKPSALITKAELLMAMGGPKGVKQIFAVIRAHSGKNEVNQQIVNLFLQGMAKSVVEHNKMVKDQRFTVNIPATFMSEKKSVTLPTPNHLIRQWVELFKAMVLTGPFTHLFNVASTALNLSLNKLIIDPIAAAMPGGLGTGKHFEVLFGLTGIMSDIKAASLFALKQESVSAQLEVLLNASPEQQMMILETAGHKWMDDNNKYLPGKFGRIVRTVGYAPLGMEDAVFKTIAFRYELAKQRAMGLPEDHAAALAAAQHDVFQQDMKLMKMVTTPLFKFLPWMGFFMPFTTTLGNLFKQSLELFPPTSLVINGTNLIGMNGVDARNRSYAKLIVGSAITLAVLAIDSGDDDEDKILNGMAPASKAKRDTWLEFNQNMGVKVFGKNYDMSKFDPLATASALPLMISRYYKAVENLDPYLDYTEINRLKSEVVQNVMWNLLLGKSFMRGTADFLDNAKAGNVNALSRFTRDLIISSVIPNFVPQVMDMVDDKKYAKYKQQDGSPGAAEREFKDAIGYKVPGMRQQMEPKLTVHGEIMPNSREGGVLVSGEEGRSVELNRWLLKNGKGVSADVKNLNDFPVELKQEYLRDRKSRLEMVKDMTDGMKPFEVKKEIEKELDKWNKDLIFQREIRGMPTAASLREAREAR